MKRKPHVDGYLMDEAEASLLGAPQAGAAGATSVPSSALSAEELEQSRADVAF